MKNTKKCESCGEWSEWSMAVDDKCTYCGELLQKREVKRVEDRKILKEMQEKAFIFNTQPGDNFFIILMKKAGYLVYLVLMGIASFISWLLFWLGP